MHHEAGSVPDQWLVRNGRAAGAIVVDAPEGAAPDRAAEALQRGLRALSGATVPVLTTPSPSASASGPWIAVGGPDVSAVAAAAEERQLTRFAELPPEGFILRTVQLDGRTVIIAGGNDAAATLYAVYELLEQLGVVFQISGDVIPETKPTLPVPDLDMHLAPVFRHRGMHCWHSARWYLGLDEIRREIDQLPKLKLNVFQFYWGLGAPWVEFAYHGKTAALTATRETGFVAWPGAGGTAESVVVGRECFPDHGYLGPPEFADVRTPAEAYRTAREFLREVIRYAHARHVRVWLTIGEIPFVPPNLLPPDAEETFEFYCGRALSPGNPAVADIWEAAMSAVIDTYPEADRYWVISGAELLSNGRPVHDIPGGDAEIQRLIHDYRHLRPLLEPRPTGDDNVDLASLNLADIAIADTLVRRLRARYPEVPLGVGLIFRGGQLRALDATLPPDVFLMNMLNFHGETDMSYFADGRGRDQVAWARVTDDGCELNVQLNAGMYDHDQTIAGGVRHGVTGLLGQINKNRGAEASARYLADGAWFPDISRRSFYRRYLRRLYGADALETLLQAYLILEDNEEELGWYGRRALFHTWCAASMTGVMLRRVDPATRPLLAARKPVTEAVKRAEDEGLFWDGRATHCGEALALLQAARERTAAGARDELDYMLRKTANLITVFDMLAAVRRGTAAFDRALLAADAADPDEARRRFDDSRQELSRAEELVHRAAKQMLPLSHIPTEKHILWIFNKSIPSHAAARTYLAEVAAACTQPLKAD